MYTESEEFNWLHQLIDWSQHYERLINARSDIRRSDGEEMDELLGQFRQLRQSAEQQLQNGKSDIGLKAMKSLNEKAHQLREKFTHFLEDEEFAVQEDDRKENRGVPIGEHTLPPLPYEYDALEPYISAEIMRLHHDKHHKGYVDGLNKAEKEMQQARKTGDFSLIRHWEVEAAFNGAGHYLHTIFWDNMKPDGGGKPRGPIMKEIKRTFGGFDAFKKHFTSAAEKVQSVGWAMLVWSPRSWRTEILQAEKHQNLSQQDMIPLLVLDVWEHAYYLQYHNNRTDYINAWWNVVDWDSVNRRYEEAQKVRWHPY
ncbi:superoxide dismutase [Virgibacillus doumboii]|uniref:superoxide dismutase n=1 Tax=Virgibacillus doumboii TaxID=2697503 RepID=UPI0013DFD303|nr:superoxide dismutase [Virgibacillus doumboii]